MTDFEVLEYRDFRKNKIVLVGETLSEDRFLVNSISIKTVNVVIKFADGTSANPKMLKSLKTFSPHEINEIQNYLLKI